MKKIFLLFLGLMCIDANLFAQSLPEIKPLSIGDTVPDVVLNQVMNYPLKTANLYHFLKNKKLLILDIWSTGCSSCIGFFPEMQELSDKFKNDLQIVLVDGKSKLWHDNEEKIGRVLKNVRENSSINIQLPVVLNCEILDTLFPYTTIPEEVWVDHNGKVIAITGAEEVNAGNIASILAGKKVAMHLKKDVLFDIVNHPLPELVYDSINSLTGHPVSSSVLYQGIIDGLGSKMGFRRDQSNQLFTGWYFTNMPLLSIYKVVYAKMQDYPDNRIIILSKDSLKFTDGNNFDSSMYRHLYSYDITIPPASMDQLRKYAQQDLERTFHVQVSIEKRKMNCLILKSSPRLKSHLAKGDKREYRMNKSDDPKYIRNFPIPELVQQLNFQYFNTPLIDETEIKEGIDMDMPDTLSQQNIVMALKKAGFEITKDERELKVVIVKDE